MRIGVTGANSVIGRAYVRRARHIGHQVIEFVRTPKSGSERQFSLGDAFDPKAFAQLDCLIHLAWDRARDSQISLATNLSGSRRVVEACQENGVYPHLLSTMSVYSKDRSQYGAGKSLVEEIFSNAGGTFLRAGLIWGGEVTPIIASLRRVALLPFICPHLSPATSLYHTFEDALIDASLEMCEGRFGADSSGDFVSATTTTLVEVQHALAGSRRKIHLRVPSTLIYWVSKGFEASRIPLPFQSDSLASLFVDESQTTPRLANGFINAGSTLGNTEFIDWLRRVGADS